MLCVLSPCFNKGGYAGNRNCSSWLCLGFFSNSDAQLPRLETYFFASFSVKTGFCNNSICSVILP